MFASKIYGVKGEVSMMRELYAAGSIEVDFEVYEDFFVYKSGVY